MSAALSSCTGASVDPPRETAAGVDSVIVAQLAGAWQWVESTGGFPYSRITPVGMWHWTRDTNDFTHQARADARGHHWITFGSLHEYREYNSDGEGPSGSYSVTPGFAFDDVRPVLILMPDTAVFLRGFAPDDGWAIGILTPDTLVLFGTASDGWYHKFARVDGLALPTRDAVEWP